MHTVVHGDMGLVQTGVDSHGSREARPEEVSGVVYPAGSRDATWSQSYSSL